ncbi:mRNA 3'-end processing protein [Aureococcus anophagefferens]|uniref:mRNA 3'-end processing protein n=1 Tax=Aureococcus anophagefferens TaxID=44056 RepID=A0ABR1G165_AURAN
MAATKQTWTLEGESELRLEVDFDAVVVVVLKQGLCEVLGVELAAGREYAFAGAKVALYSWHGCQLETRGECASVYQTGPGETTAAAAQRAQLPRRGATTKARAPWRERARAGARGVRPGAGAARRGRDCRGPRVMVVGPSDSGKSTLAATLLGYAARLGREPTFVELDPALGDCGAPPGAVAAARVTRETLSVDEGFGSLDCAPLSYWFGYEAPREHPDLYARVVDELAVAVAEKLDGDRSANVAGLVVATSSWVDGDGFASLLRVASAFAVDAVLVLAHDRLFADLRQALPPSVAVAKLPRSGGVVQRDVVHRRRAKHRKIHEYFYGPQSHARSLLAKKDDDAALDKLLEATAPPLAPATHELPFRAVRVFKVLAGSTGDDSMLPVGQGSMLEPLQVVAVTVSPVLVHNVLAVCHPARDGDDAGDDDEHDDAAADAATSPHQHLLGCAAAGFVVVTNVNVEAQTITLLGPCSGDLPSRNLLLGKLEWMESNIA